MLAIYAIIGCQHNNSADIKKISERKLSESHYTIMGRPLIFLQYNDSMSVLSNKNNLLAYNINTGELVKKLNFENLQVIDSLLIKYLSYEDFKPKWENDNYRISGVSKLKGHTLSCFVYFFKRYKKDVKGFEDVDYRGQIPYVLNIDLRNFNVENSYIVLDTLKNVGVYPSPLFGYQAQNDKVYVSAIRYKKTAFGDVISYVKNGDSYKFSEFLFQLPIDSSYFFNGGSGYSRNFASSVNRDSLLFLSPPNLVSLTKRSNKVQAMKILDLERSSDLLSNIEVSTYKSKLLITNTGKNKSSLVTKIYSNHASGETDLISKESVKVEGLVNFDIYQNTIYSLVKKEGSFYIQKFLIDA